MKNKEYKSRCCNAAVKVGGLPDFEGDKYPCTVHYVCTKCNEPCDIKEIKVNKKLERSIKRGIKDIQGGKVTPAETVSEGWEEEKKWEKKHPVLTKFKRIWWWIRYGIKNKIEEIPLRIRTFIQRGKRGWADSDSWSFDHYLANIIAGGVGNLIKYGHHEVHDSEAFKKIKKTFETAKKISEGDLIYIPSKDFKWADYKRWKRTTKKINKKHKCKDKVMTKRESIAFEKGFDIFKDQYFRLWD